jgi:alanine racemase
MHAMIRRTRVEVDLGAVVANARRVRDFARTPVIAVVKADGYGHGAVAVAQALEKAQATAGFAVSLVEEGVTLRDAGITSPVLVMGPSQHGGEEEMLARGLTPIVASEEDFAALADAVARTGQPAEAHL